MSSYRIAVIPGDGIGPEVIREAVSVLDAAAAFGGFTLERQEYDLGVERYVRTGEVLPNSVVDELGTFDSVLLGAVGDDPRNPRIPQGVLEVGLLLRLRQELDLYVNLRPAKLFEGVESPLASAAPADVDLVIVRENTEGLYSRKGQAVRVGSDQETATEMSINTAASVERILRYAFEVARERGAPLTLVHKTNVLERAGSLYSRLFEKVGSEFPDVPTSYQHVDAAVLLLVTNPRLFRVIVTDNMFGDVLSDLAAALVGGLGWVGSGNIHPGRVSIFEPVHGSAPDITGTGKANPTGAVLSAALMLRHLGESAAAGKIESAVARVAGKWSSDGLTTTQFGDLLVQELA